MKFQRPATPSRLLAVAIATFAAFAPSAFGQGLPPVPVPPENPQTPEKIVLGKILFFEEQVSRDNTTACATCHLTDAGGGDPRALSPLNIHPGPDNTFGTSDDIRGSRGIVRCNTVGHFIDDGTFFPNPLVTNRKAPSAIGAMWDPESFWDGRAQGTFRDPVTQQIVIAAGGALESQAVLPPTAGEMGCVATSLALICSKLTAARPMRLATSLTPDIQAALAANPTYPALFQAAFGTPGVTPARFGMAIAAYERTLVPDQTPFDAFLAGQTSALTANQQEGLAVFQGVGICSQCHALPVLTDFSFRNIGVRPPTDDPGRQNFTQNVADRGKFKVPGLRNIALRAPYFHNGSLTTLMQVVEFYVRGGDFADNRDPLMVPIALTFHQRIDLVDFLEHGLTDPRVVQRTAPFDRPILHSELPPNPTTFGTRSPGAGGLSPRMMAHLPPMIGADRFGIGISNAVGGALAVLGLSSAPLGSPIVLGTTSIWITLDPSTLLLPVALGGAPLSPGAGTGTFMVGLPDSPVLNGLTIYAQWAVTDAVAPAGIAASEAVAFTFFAP